VQGLGGDAARKEIVWNTYA